MEDEEKSIKFSFELIGEDREIQALVSQLMAVGGRCAFNEYIV